MECLWRQLQRRSQEQRTVSWRALEASAGEAQAVKMSEMSAGKREGVMYLISNQPGLSLYPVVGRVQKHQQRACSGSGDGPPCDGSMVCMPGMREALELILSLRGGQRES
jgi:hypothetical protein